MIPSLLAHILARPAVAQWLITRAQRTPYRHLPGYMGRKVPWREYLGLGEQ